MSVQEKFILQFGNPMKNKINFERKFMKVFSYNEVIRKNIPSLGHSIYCNINFYPVYEKFLLLLIFNGLYKEIKSNDECYNIRYVRGIDGLLSVHSWGMAVDLNTSDNPLGVTREAALKRGLTPFTNEFIDTAIAAGLVAGYNFTRCDGMHFENTKNV